jgi:AcrR family transcriptional regulator
MRNVGATVPRRTTRTRLDSSTRRDQLIELGLELLVTRPIEDISVEEIARKAGISNGLLFHYFPTKRDYHLAVTQAAADQLIAAITPAEPLDPPAQLRYGLAAYVEFVERYPKTYEALLRGSSGARRELTGIHRTARQELADWTITELPVASPLMVLSVHAWLSFVEEATASWLHERVVDRQTLVDFLFSVFIVIQERAYHADEGRPLPSGAGPRPRRGPLAEGAAGASKRATTAAPKQAAPKQAAPKKAAPKQAAPKTAAPKKAAPTKAARTTKAAAIGRPAAGTRRTAVTSARTAAPATKRVRRS